MRTEHKSISTIGIICICFGFLLSWLIATRLYSNDADAIEEKFARDMDVHAFAIQKQVAQDITILHSIKGIFDAMETVSRTISRNQFDVLSQVLIRRHPSLQAVGWIPYITAGERVYYEEWARKDGLHTFEITERLAQGSMARAGEREVYYPVFYIVPYAGNEAALGFDLGSNPTRLEALQSARDSGEAQPTRRIQLVQGDGEAWAQLFFVPIYKGRPTNPLERKTSLGGFISGVFRIDDIMNTSGVLQNIDPSLHLELIDIHPDGNELLFETDAGNLELNEEAQYSRTMDLSTERKWMLRVTPSKQYIQEQRSSTPLLVFLFGMFITWWLAHYLTRQKLEKDRVANEVKVQTKELLTRTEDLASANTKLTKQAAEREKMQQQFANLTDHEQRRLGQELHDSLGQQVAVAAMMAHNLEDALEGADEYQRKQLRHLTQSIDTSQAQIRAISKGLLPVEIGSGGLQSALEELTASIRKLDEYEIELICDESGFNLDNAVSTQLYRIAQESVRNAIEHADVRRITIHVHHADGGVVMVIKDDGKGFDFDSGTAIGSGLRIMKHRAELIGAEFRVESIPDQSTSIICYLPDESEASTD